jgi:hypothetical protein
MKTREELIEQYPYLIKALQTFGYETTEQFWSFVESYASQFKSNWIELQGLVNEFDDCDCWLIDRRGNISISQVGEFIEIGKYTHYMKIEKPQPPTN